MAPSLTRTRWLALACVALSAPVTAVAQPRPDAATIERARALNKKAEDLFAIAEYDRAIAAFKEAYELAPTPGLLFNIAQAYRLKGPEGCKSAVRFYRNYLLALPAGPNRATVDKHLAELEPCPDLAQPAQPGTEPAPPPEPARPVRDDTPARRPDRWPHAIAIGGGAVAVIGGVLFVVADRKYNSLADGECAARDCPESTWSSYRTMERAGVGLLAVGTAAAITGVVWALARSTPADEPTAVTGWVTPSGGGLAVMGRF